MAHQQLENVIERPAKTTSGFPMLLFGLAMEAFSVWRFIHAIRYEDIPALVVSLIVSVLGVIVLVGLFTVQPNESRVLVFFGRYIGSCRLEGFRWGNPFAIKKRVSLRVRNLTSETIRSTMRAVVPSRSHRSSFGESSIRPRLYSMWITTSSSSTSRSKRR